jgi:lysophospholipase L1-like esterase
MIFEMKNRRSSIAIAIVLAVQLGTVSAQKAAPPKTAAQEYWVPTWATAQQLIRVVPAQTTPTPTPAAVLQTSPTASANTAQPAAPAPAVAPGGGRGGPPPLPPLQTLNNQTVRMIARTSIGGRRVRIKLANAFNGTPVQIGSAHIAVRDKDSAIVSSTDRTLSFSGKTSFRMTPGMVVVSDPVDLTVPPLADMAVSLFFPGETGPPTTHAAGLRSTYISNQGDFSASVEIPDPTIRTSYYWLASIEVERSSETPLIVAYGDSITDGARSTPDTNNTWPAILATRLAAEKTTAHMAIVNQGIGGNRVLTDGANFAGVSALARLDRDVLSQPGVKWLIMLEGINDIGSGTAPNALFPVTAEDLIWGLRQVVERAHQRGIKVAGCTITPYEGAGYYREQGEAIRQKVNEWIRSSGVYDAVVDFDAATRDPTNLKRLRPEFDPGDHLHPNDAGYRAMAEVVDLRIFRY